MPPYKIDPSEYPIIIRLYRDEKISAEQLAKTYGVTNWTILKILKDNGVEIRSAAGYHTSAQNAARNEAMISLIADGNTIAETAKHLGVTYSTVIEKLVKLGVYVIQPGARRSRYSEEQLLVLKNKARMFYKCGLSIRQISMRLRIHDRTVVQFLQEEPAIPIRASHWKQARRARALAQQRLNLYQSGMTFAEIDRYLDDPKGAARISLKKHFPQEVSNAKQHAKTVKRKTQKRQQALDFS